MHYDVQPQQLAITSAAVEAVRKGAVSPGVFWKSIKQRCPELSTVAQMLLCVPPSSASSERVYNSVARVWSDLRSRLTHDRVQKLLYIYFNKRALQRDGAAAYDWEEFQEWLCNVLD